MIKFQSEDARNLDFWLSDLKNRFEENNKGITLEYSIYKTEEYCSSVSFNFYPTYFRNEILIEIVQNTIPEAINKITQRILHRCVV